MPRAATPTKHCCKSDVVWFWRGLFSPKVPQRGCWLSVTWVCLLSQPPKSLWKRTRQRDLRALPALQLGFILPLTCSRCLNQSHIMFVLHAGLSPSWWEKNKSRYRLSVRGCSSISSPPSTVSINRRRKQLMNERSAVQASREPLLL